MMTPAVPTARLLVVEDEIITARDLQDSLEELGYDVPEIASSGAEALDQAAALRPDIVLMDINLGDGRDGIEVAGELRGRFGIPVIYLTAYADQATLSRAATTAPLGYLIKPFERRELHATVQMALVKRQLDEQLRQSENWYATSLASIGDGVVATDAGGLVKFVNPVAEGLTGWTHAEALGRPLDEVLPFFERTAQVQQTGLAARVLAGKATVCLEEGTLLRTRAGDLLAVDNSAAPIHDPHGGGELGVVVVFRDVGEKQRVAAELERARRLESLGTLAGGLAHDLNNILAIIAGNVSLVNSPGAPPEMQSRAFAKIDSAVRRAKALTSQFLTFSKGGEPVCRPVDLGVLLREEAEQICADGGGDEPGMDFGTSIEIGRDLWSAEADEAQIRRVVENLVRNAIQALPAEGGHITARASNCATADLPAGLAATLTADGRRPDPAKGYVRLEIIDNGCGIAPENLGQICDPYFTTRTTGSGLGLSVCQSIARKHGGGLYFESVVGEGTTAALYLPAQPSSIHRGMEDVRGPASAANPEGAGLRVLVMDDEPLMCDLLSMMLAHLGHVASTTRTGEEGLRLYQEAEAAGRPFDMVIIDLVNKVGMGGQEMMSRLRALAPNVVALVCSGYCDHPIMANHQAFGFRGCLSKPISVEDLRNGLRAATAAVAMAGRA